MNLSRPAQWSACLWLTHTTRVFPTICAPSTLPWNVVLKIMNRWRKYKKKKEPKYEGFALFHILWLQKKKSIQFTRFDISTIESIMQGSKPWWISLRAVTGHPRRRQEEDTGHWDTLWRDHCSIWTTHNDIHSIHIYINISNNAENNLSLYRVPFWLRESLIKSISLNLHAAYDMDVQRVRFESSHLGWLSTACAKKLYWEVRSICRRANGGFNKRVWSYARLGDQA